MRVIVLGAGAIGGTIGARVAEAGHDVSLVARGAHAAAMRAGGLRVVSPDGELTVHVPVAEHPSELRLAGDEVVVLAVKSQDTVAALDALALASRPNVTIACAQNGIANEREALRRFPDVLAVYVWLPALHLEPGIVQAERGGQLDVGRYPRGTDERVAAIAQLFASAGFSSQARSDVMRWKHRKLITNLGSVVDALCSDGEAARALAERARAEGEAVLRAAGLELADEPPHPRPELVRAGGSSWQSLARGTGTIETDHLNGEIVLLGRLHGIATPVNARLQQLARAHARARLPPRTLDARDLMS